MFKLRISFFYRLLLLFVIVPSLPAFATDPTLLAVTLARATNTTEHEARQNIAEIGASALAVLKLRGEVSIKNFGTLSVRRKSARRGALATAGKLTLHFSPAQKLLRELEEGGAARHLPAPRARSRLKAALIKPK